ncbi:unnamed protein product [Boreogadus saida]
MAPLRTLSVASAAWNALQGGTAIHRGGAVGRDDEEEEEEEEGKEEEDAEEVVLEEVEEVEREVEMRRWKRFRRRWRRSEMHGGGKEVSGEVQTLRERSH